MTLARCGEQELGVGGRGLPSSQRPPHWHQQSPHCRTLTRGGVSPGPGPTEPPRSPAGLPGPAPHPSCRRRWGLLWLLPAPQGTASPGPPAWMTRCAWGPAVLLTLGRGDRAKRPICPPPSECTGPTSLSPLVSEDPQSQAGPPPHAPGSCPCPRAPSGTGASGHLPIQEGGGFVRASPQDMGLRRIWVPLPGVPSALLCGSPGLMLRFRRAGQDPRPSRPRCGGGVGRRRAASWLQGESRGKDREAEV